MIETVDLDYLMTPEHLSDDVETTEINVLLVAYSAGRDLPPPDVVRVGDQFWQFSNAASVLAAIELGFDYLTCRVHSLNDLDVPEDIRSDLKVLLH